MESINKNIGLIRNEETDEFTIIRDRGANKIPERMILSEAEMVSFVECQMEVFNNPDAPWKQDSTSEELEREGQLPLIKDT